MTMTKTKTNPQTHQAANSAPKCVKGSKPTVQAMWNAWPDAAPAAKAAPDTASDIFKARMKQILQAYEVAVRRTPDLEPELREKLHDHNVTYVRAHKVRAHIRRMSRP
jgi:hypothetical protein